MGLTTRPSKNINLSKIDDIQDEFFGEAASDDHKNAEAIDFTTESNKMDSSESETSSVANDFVRNSQKRQTSANLTKEISKSFKRNSTANEEKLSSLKIADLFEIAKTEGIRYTSRPYTVPRSLTIDLNRLKSKFKIRDLHYTQTDLMDKMIKESLEIVTADNYFSQRERALKFVKSPEHCSRRSVTLTEETACEMAELKADIALTHNRRIYSDEIFTTLLAVAFSELYENNLL